MLVALVLIAVTLLAIFLLALLWRRECRRAGVPVKPYVFWFPALLGLVAAVVFVGFGLSNGVVRLLGDIHDYQPAAKQLVAGESLSGLDNQQLPLLGLIHALQAELSDHPSASGWQSLSRLYQQLSEQTDLNANVMAVTAARRALALAPGDAGTQLLLAQQLIAANEGKLGVEAKALIAQVLELHPDYDGAWLLQAMAAIKAGDYALAQVSFETLLAHHPDDRASELLQQSLAKVKQERARAEYFAHIKVQVLAGKQTLTGGTLFVFVRELGSSGKPLAAKRVLLNKLPMTLELTAADWLDAMPDIDTKLVVGGRYAKGAAASVVDSQELLNVPLQRQAGGLEVELQLP